MSTVYIYALTQPDQPWNIRYIGKVLHHTGETPMESIERRLRKHLWECGKKLKTYKLNWLRSLGTKPGCVLLDIWDVADCNKMERFHIASHRKAGYKLTNGTEGGDGLVGPTMEVRQRMSLAHAGKIRGQYSPQHCAAISAAKKGKVANRPGYQHSQETKTKIAASNTRLTLTFNGKTQSVKQWSTETGLREKLIYERINRNGWTVEKTLTSKVGSVKPGPKHQL